MDLQISVFLLFILFTAGHSLRCYECRNLDGSCSNQEVETCPSGFYKCMSSTSMTQFDGIPTMSRGKRCSANCPRGSVNYGIIRSVTVCCETDLCNAQDTPDLRTMVPNGKKCYYCNEKSCLNIMSCSESEDGCITLTPKKMKEEDITRTSRGQPRVLKGCISKDICNSMVSGTEDISCCSGNLCNGAQSVTQSFLFLCCSLLAFILLH